MYVHKCRVVFSDCFTVPKVVSTSQCAGLEPWGRERIHAGQNNCANEAIVFEGIVLHTADLCVHVIAIMLDQAALA